MKFQFSPVIPDYSHQRYPFILSIEESGVESLDVYTDSKGFATIGSGFLVSAWANEILTALYPQIDRETRRKVATRIQSKTNNVNFGQGTIGASAAQRAIDSAFHEELNDNTRVFKFSNSAQVRSSFELIIGKIEQQLDAWFGAKNGSIPNSKERLALLSLAYNNITNASGKSPSLKNAILQGNRAEAWYEIRYASNRNKLNGLAKRRYYESAMFGLYNPAGSGDPSVEATQIYRMFTMHREDILAYETTYGPQVEKANRDYNLSGTEYAVRTLRHELAPAAAILMNTYIKPEYGFANTFDPLNIQIASPARPSLSGENSSKRTSSDADLLIADGEYIAELEGNAGDDLLIGTTKAAVLLGGDGNDTLAGGNGNDILDGGAGNDVIIGGAGEDLYFIDGHDRIIDTGRNKIVFNDQIIAGIFTKTSENTYTFTSDDGSIAPLTFHSPGVLSLGPDDSVTFALQTRPTDFANKDFGFTLLDEPPPTTLVLNGTDHRDEMGFFTLGPNPEHWRLFFASFPSGPTGSILHEMPLPPVAPRITVNGGDSGDFLFGFQSRDILSGNGGNDILNGNLTAFQGKPMVMTGPLEGDVLDGGDGNDWVSGSGGDDQMRGGPGNDVLDGLNGGDHVTGGSGNDVLAGGSNDDVLGGSDGDDILSGDGYFTSASGNLLNLSLDVVNSVGVTFSTSAAGYHVGYTTMNFALRHDAPHDGNDYLNGGAGQDVLYGGAGNDAIAGGDGHDALFGGDGHDFLDAGSGNDLLQGDDGDDRLFGGIGEDQLQAGTGNDLLYGGEDNDTLLGQDGEDQLHGGSGIDLLWAGYGDDVVHGDDGDDQLFGEGGLDLLHGGNGNDQILGSQGNDELHGDAGNDRLDGGDGDDRLEGGDGDDVLIGGIGVNVLVGGAGNDTYIVGTSSQNTIFDDDEYTLVTDPAMPASTSAVAAWQDGSLNIGFSGAGSVSLAGFTTVGTPGHPILPQFGNGYDGIRVPLGGFGFGGSVIGGMIRSMSTGLPFDVNALVSVAGSTLTLDEFLATCPGPNEADFTAAGAVAPPPVRRDPIILDLDGDGVETTRRSLATFFDHDNDGFAENTAWVSPDDGLLVRDIDGDGLITQGLELFGDNALMRSGQRAANGFAALGDLDSNKDGAIDASDVSFQELCVWRDTNADAMTTPDELFTLDSLEIRQLSGAAQPSNMLDANGNTMTGHALFRREDGSSGIMAEFRLQTNLGLTRDARSVAVSEDIAALPWLAGAGKVADLHQAMALDQTGSLQRRVQEFVSATNVQNRDAILEELLASWAGVQSVAAGSRGVFYDARRLAVIEAFMGQPFFGSTGPNPIFEAAPHLDSIYSRIKESCHAQLMMQTHLYDLFTKVEWVHAQDGRSIADLSHVADAISDRMLSEKEAGVALLREFARTWRAYNSLNTLGYLNFREHFVTLDPNLGWIMDAAGLPERGGTNLSEAIANKAGSFSLSSGNGNDVLYGNDGGESLHQGAGNALLFGGAGNDSLSGGPGDDILDGGDDSDWLLGRQGADTYIFRRGSGCDSIVEYGDSERANIIYIGSFLRAEDLVCQRSGDDLVLKLSDRDQLTVQGWFGQEPPPISHVLFSDGSVINTETLRQRALRGTTGDDRLIGYASSDHIEGLAGNDAINGGNGNDVLDGGEGSDWLAGGQGSDTYIFRQGSGSDVISEDGDPSWPNTVYVENVLDMDDIEYRRSRDDLVLKINDRDRLTVLGWFGHEHPPISHVLFSDGSVIGAETLSQLTLQGTDGDDRLIGYASSDHIEGRAGNDVIESGNGDDTLDGGPGQDHLSGGVGSDTYSFRRGSGLDLIVETASTDGDIDTVRLGEDINPEDVTLARIANDLYLSVRGTADRVCVRDWFSHADRRVERIVFADGALWDQEAIRLKMSAPTESDDLLFGTDDNDILDGGGGDDTLSGFRGNDRLYGGPGNDDLDGGYGDNEFYGGPGDDAINGAKGKNSYFFERGDGFDHVVVRNSRWEGWISGQTLHFGPGIRPDEVSIQINGREDTDLFMAVGTGHDEGILFMAQDGYGGVDFPDWPGDTGGYGGYGGFTDFPVGRFTFADGTTWSLEQILTRADAGRIGERWGEPGDDLLLGSVARDSIHGSWDNDELDARDQDDQIFGGDGHDAMNAGSGNDLLQGGSGDDILAGGPGSDILDGQSGSDTYVFNRGDGQDSILRATDAAPSDVSTISFGRTIAPADIMAHVDENGHLILQLTGSDDHLALPWFNAASGHTEIDDDNAFRMQFINRAGATVFDLTANVRARSAELLRSSPTEPIAMFAPGTETHILSDTLAAGGQYATAYALLDDLFGIPGDYVGSDGDDVLLGRGGDDKLSGGRGNDVLRGDGGSDTYIFHSGDGRDRVFEMLSDIDDNVISFGPGITPESVTLDHDPEMGHLILRIGENGDELRVNHFSSVDPLGPNVVSRFVFADGSVLTWKQMIEKGFDIVGRDGDDFLTGTGASDRILGVRGNDTLVGGRGNDILQGGPGNDTYFFNLGDGVDAITDLVADGEPNTLVFGPGITPQDLALGLTYHENALGIRIGSNGEEIWLSGFNPEAAEAGSRAVQHFVFADGARLDYENLLNNTFIIQGGFEADNIAGTNLSDRVYGYEGNDTLHGRDGDDVMTGGAGNDHLFGGAGSDTYVFNLGDGQDTLVDTGIQEEGNRIVFGPGIRRESLRVSHDGDVLNLFYGNLGDAIQLQGFDFNELIGSHVARDIEFSDGGKIRLSELVDPGTDGDDGIVGSVFDDTINARNGNDTTYARSGNDVIQGGDGHDRLFGEDGDDRLIGGHGNDELTGGYGDDAYVFNLGDGQDTIWDHGAPLEGNRIIFGPGITRHALSLHRDGAMLTVRVGNHGDVIRLMGYDPENGNHVVRTFEFTDGSAISVQHILQNSNTAPEAVMPIPNQHGMEGESFVFSVPEGTFRDVDDGDALKFRAHRADGNSLPSWLSFEPSTCTFSGRPGDGDAGNLKIMVEATDLAGASALQSFLLIIRPSSIIETHATYGTEGWDRIRTGSDNDTIHALGGWDSVMAGARNDTVHGGNGWDALFGEGGNDRLFGEGGNDGLFGGRGNDVLDGGIGHDALFGAHGNDILQGGGGNDILTDLAGNNLLHGNAGSDILTGGPGSSLFIGGKGNDTLNTGSGANIIAFNRGDGMDMVHGGKGRGTVSLGGGIKTADLSFRKSKNDLVLETGNSEGLVFRNWYLSPSSKTVATLQVILDPAVERHPSLANSIQSQRFERFDFSGLASAFDRARLANPALSRWTMTEALTRFHLAGSDTEALGGDLAGWFGRNGSLTDLNVASAQEVLASEHFGITAQTLRPFNGMQNGSPKLA